jgi:hypothetical protein
VLADGSWLLAGWEFASRAEAIAKTVELIEDLPRVDIIVGASLLPDPQLAVLPAPLKPATSAETKQGLPLMRELAGQGQLHWDPDDGLELGAALERCRVVERQTGLVIVGGDRSDLIRAAAWALLAQAQPKPVPAIY